MKNKLDSRKWWNREETWLHLAILFFSWSMLVYIENFPFNILLWVSAYFAGKTVNKAFSSN